MITVQNGEQIILSATEKSMIVKRSIYDLKNEILREPIFADRNLPPFNRSAMDGIAISSTATSRSFKIEAIQKAGEQQKTLQDNNNCLEVMTGAVVPKNCNVVIPYELVTIDNGIATIEDSIPINKMANIHIEGSDQQKGNLLIEEGTVLEPSHWAVLASVGKAEVLVSERPSIAIISTGDELIPVEESPQSHQIRNSNSHAVKAALLEFGFDDITLYHLPDEKEPMSVLLQKILLNHRYILLSGGVSKGKFDFVPQILTDLAVEKKFHKVSQRPGKPLWFGVGPKQQYVFGLPGNPVSTLICTYRYVLPSLQKHLSQTVREPFSVVLDESVNFKKDLTLFQPVALTSNDSGQLVAKPVKPNGSGDFSTLTQSQGFIELPQDKQIFNKGEVYPLYFWRDL